MKALTGESILGSVSGLISEGHQVRDMSIDLTVKRVFSLEDAGSLDFGGSEQKDAKRNELPPVKEGEDEHGWWSLSSGIYLIELNEKVDPIEGLGLMSPHPNLLKAGCTHSTLFVHEWKGEYILPINVGSKGLDIKENAKVSKLMVLA